MLAGETLQLRGYGRAGALQVRRHLARHASYLEPASQADPAHLGQRPQWADLFSGFRGAWTALKRGEVWRWLLLLEFSDLMLDVLLGFLALYFHDVVGLTETQAAGAVFVWLLVGLAGDFLLIPLLEKVDGLKYLRTSVVLELLLFPAFLLAPWVWAKLVLAGLLAIRRYHDARGGAAA